MTYDVMAIRQQFAALDTTDEQGQMPLFLDGPGGSQIPKSVLDALIAYLSKYNSNLGGYADAGQRTIAINQQARQAAATWLNCAAKNMIFGLNSTSLMFQISRVVGKNWQAGDNIVLSSIDHFSNVSSWQSIAEERGVEIRKLPLNQDGSALDFNNLSALIDSKTKLVAVSLASNVLGTKTPMQALIQHCQSVGALLCIDAVHAVVHELIDIHALQCDVLFASSYKLGGAHLGMAYLSDRVILLSPYKVEPATNLNPNAWEQGTQSFEAQAALIALVEYWANLAQYHPDFDASISNLRQRLQWGYQAVQQHEQQLMQHFLAEAKKRAYFKLYGLNCFEQRTPTFAFNVFKNQQMILPSLVSQWFGEKNVALPSGNFYALDVVRHLDLLDTGFLRAGFLHYNTLAEVDQFFAYLDEYMAKC
ncbi:aminotransferase class V-fold PLP-dependent enzyme [Acinetobacter sp. c3-l95]|uniref:aminotransferase class V-fold PLP-dependent enzyme n=1 Tax=Acinetobacter sp. c3-l95 TaxID=3342804 RepID=UPI0035BB6125